MTQTLPVFPVPKTRTPFAQVQLSQGESPFIQFPALKGQAMSLQDLDGPTCEKEAMYSFPVFHKNMDYEDLVHAEMGKNNMLVQSTQRRGSVVLKSINKSLTTFAQQAKCEYAKKRKLSERFELKHGNGEEEEINKVAASLTSLDLNGPGETRHTIGTEIEVHEDHEDHEDNDSAESTDEEQEDMLSIESLCCEGLSREQAEKKKVLCLNSICSKKQNVQIGGINISLSSNSTMHNLSFKGKTIKAII